MSDELSFKLHYKEYWAAAAIAYDFLMLNSSLLSVNPLTLPRPPPLGAPVEPKQVSEVLPLYLQQLTFVLLTQHNTQHHCDHYSKVRLKTQRCSPFPSCEPLLVLSYPSPPTGGTSAEGPNVRRECPRGAEGSGRGQQGLGGKRHGRCGREEAVASGGGGG